jgi:hypothetical protein
MDILWYLVLRADTLFVQYFKRALLIMASCKGRLSELVGLNGSGCSSSVEKKKKGLAVDHN